MRSPNRHWHGCVFEMKLMLVPFHRATMECGVGLQELLLDSLCGLDSVQSEEDQAADGCPR